VVDDQPYPERRMRQLVEAISQDLGRAVAIRLEPVSWLYEPTKAVRNFFVIILYLKKIMRKKYDFFMRINKIFA
jgi:hypothetical protein